MDERLRNLKKSMKATSFRELDFTESHIQKIHKKIRQDGEDKDTILQAVLQLFLEEKTGYEVAKQLRGRGIEKYEDNEGLFYTMLHTLEQKHFLVSRWADETTKLYHITSKGRRELKKLEKVKQKERVSLKKLNEVSD